MPLGAWIDTLNLSWFYSQVDDEANVDNQSGKHHIFQHSIVTRQKFCPVPCVAANFSSYIAMSTFTVLLSLDPNDKIIVKARGQKLA